MKRAAVILGLFGATQGCTYLRDQFRPYPPHYYEYLEKEKAERAQKQLQDEENERIRIANAEQAALDAKDPSIAATECCQIYGRIDELNSSMKRQKRIEAESGITDMQIRRSLGESLVRAKDELAEAKAHYKKLTGKDFVRADWSNCK